MVKVSGKFYVMCWGKVFHYKSFNIMFEICVSKNVMGILLKAWKKERMKGLMFYGSVSNDSQEQDFAKRRTVPAFAKTTESVVHFCCDSDLGEKFRGF